MSLNPKELETFIKNIRTAEICLGNEKNKPTKKENKLIKYSRRGLFSSKIIKKGKKITTNDIVYKRPSIYMPIKYEKKILGKRIKKSLNIDEPFQKKHF